MKRRAKAHRWAREQARDPWVRRARAEGLPSRAAFKLEELIARYGLLTRGAKVLELGAAPGGWTRIAANAISPGGQLVAVDRLAMSPPPGVRFIQGDLAAAATRAEAIAALDGAADVVLCDLAPNITGLADVDGANQDELTGLATDFAAAALKPGGALLVKVFEGTGGTRLRERLTREYRRVRHVKPAASRARSREFYLLAEGFRPGREIAADHAGAV